MPLPRSAFLPVNPLFREPFILFLAVSVKKIPEPSAGSAPRNKTVFRCAKWGEEKLKG
jgi:hypothetical protein